MYIINRKQFKDQAEFARYGRGCATKDASAVEIRRIDEEIASNRFKRVLFDKLKIAIKFTHFTYGASGTITKQQRTEQIEILDAAFKGAKVSFIYDEAEVKFVDNYSWYKMGHRSFAEREAKMQLSQDTSKYLNFYTGALQPGLLGWATFPFDLAGDPIMDGVVVLDQSMPGGEAQDYNLGMTGVHEVGHWLGLFHTFQGGCSGFGDHVHDTPAHSEPNYGTPNVGEPHNACKQGEFAPIHNYMNYVNDAWMKELTAAQCLRIQEHILMYRIGLVNIQH